MSRSLRTLRLWIVFTAILASNACMGNPFEPGNVSGGGVTTVPPGGIPDVCSDSANSGLPGCRYRH